MSENKSNINICGAENKEILALPYANSGIQAGFPSPAKDYISESIDLNVELVQHPASTFYGRISGDSMIEEGIDDGDILVIDRSLSPINGDLVVCCIDGEFTLKRIKVNRDKAWLIPSNSSFEPILVTSENRFCIWGVVSYTIKRNRRKRDDV